MSRATDTNRLAFASALAVVPLTAGLASLSRTNATAGSRTEPSAFQWDGLSSAVSWMVASLAAGVFCLASESRTVVTRALPESVRRPQPKGLRGS
jgi:hypothetical protein